MEGSESHHQGKDPDWATSFATRAESIPGCTLRIFADTLYSDAPLALCIGECGESVHAAGVQTLQLTFNSNVSIVTLLEQSSNLFQDLFKITKEMNSKGVYLIGFGFGAFIAAKLLADQDVLLSSNVFQAAYLVSGIYDIQKESIDAMLNCIPTKQTSPNSGSPPGHTSKKQILIDNLLWDKQFFDDKKNVSFLCELGDQSPIFGDFFVDDLKKFKQCHGIRSSSNDDLMNSPVYQSILSERMDKESVSSECERSVAVSVDDVDLFKLFSDEFEHISALDDNYTHLCPMGVRIYVFAGEKDSLVIQRQSRTMYDRLSRGCRTGNMHFEIKEGLDRCKMKSLFKSDDNFLKRLIRYDVVNKL